jgi:prevent-host-death family protein
MHSIDPMRVERNRAPRFRPSLVDSGTALDQLGQEPLASGMSKSVNIYVAKTKLSELVDRAAAGEEVIIAKAGKPVARLVALRSGDRKPGRWAGKIRVAADFDAPLPDEIASTFESAV